MGSLTLEHPSGSGVVEGIGSRNPTEVKPVPEVHDEEASSSLPLIVGSIGGCVVLVLAVVCGYCMCKRANRHRSNPPASDLPAALSNGGPTLLETKKAGSLGETAADLENG